MCPNLSATRATTRQVAGRCAGIARRRRRSSANASPTGRPSSSRRVGRSASSSVMIAALRAAQLSTANRGRNTRFLTYLTPHSTDPFSQPLAGAQNSARNGYPPRNASNASVSARSRPANTALTASEVLSRTTRSTRPPK